VLFSALLFARRITGRDIFAIAVSYVGIAIAFGHDVATQPGNVVLGSFWVLLSALFYAAYLIGSGRIVHRVGTLRFATYAGLVSSVAVVTHFLVTRDGGLLVSQAMPVYWLSFLMASSLQCFPSCSRRNPTWAQATRRSASVDRSRPSRWARYSWTRRSWYQLVGAALVLTGVLAISLAKGNGAGRYTLPNLTPEEPRMKKPMRVAVTGAATDRLQPSLPHRERRHAREGPARHPAAARFPMKRRRR
jgi:hypothetical protein